MSDPNANPDGAIRDMITRWLRQPDGMEARLWMPIEAALVAQDRLSGQPEDNHDPHVARAPDPEDVVVEVLAAAADFIESRFPGSADPSPDVADQLLSDEFVERLWSHLPLTTYCTCEEEWDDASETFSVDEGKCQCNRRTIPCVRNALAAVLGEPEIPYVDPVAAMQFGRVTDEEGRRDGAQGMSGDGGSGG